MTESLARESLTTHTVEVRQFFSETHDWGTLYPTFTHFQLVQFSVQFQVFCPHIGSAVLKGLKLI